MIARRSAAEIAALAFSFVATVALARSLGPSLFGYYAAAAVISQVGVILTGLGLAQMGGLLVARDRAAPARVVPLVCIPRLVSSFILCLGTICVCATGVLGPTLSPILAVTSIGWLFSAIRLEWFFVARGELGTVSALRVLAGLALVSAAAAAAISRDVTTVGLTITLPLAIPAIVGAALARSHTPASWITPRLAEVVVALRAGVDFMVGELGTFATMSSDRLFLLVFSSPAVLGLYDAAYRVILPFYSVAAIVNDSSFAGLAASNRQQTMRAYSYRTLAVTVPVGFVLTLVSKPVIDLLYGGRYSEAAPYLAVLGWVITVGFLSGVVVFPLAAWGRHREYGAAVTAGGLASLVGNAVLIQPLAGIGAALATIAGKAASAATGYVYFGRSSAYPIGRDVLKALGASAIAVLPAAGCLAALGEGSWLLAFLAYGVTYIASSVIVFGYRELWAALVDDGGRSKSSSMS